MDDRSEADDEDGRRGAQDDGDRGGEDPQADASPPAVGGDSAVHHEEAGPGEGPAPDVILHALAGLHVTAQQAWMVGDSRFDREAARAASVRFVGLRIDGDLRIEELTALAELLAR